MSRRYTAFISYRHADNTQEGRRWAEWLHRALERYTVPPDLIGTPNLRSSRSAVSPWVRKEVREFKELGRIIDIEPRTVGRV